jgi:hypothetical protein
MMRLAITMAAMRYARHDKLGVVLFGRSGSLRRKATVAQSSLPS